MDWLSFTSLLQANLIELGADNLSNSVAGMQVQWSGTVNKIRIQSIELGGNVIIRMPAQAIATADGHRITVDVISVGISPNDTTVIKAWNEISPGDLIKFSAIFPCAPQLFPSIDIHQMCGGEYIAHISLGSGAVLRREAKVASEGIA